MAHIYIQILKKVSKHLNASVQEQGKTIYRAGSNQKMLSEASSCKRCCTPQERVKSDAA
jgi:hypothetical protein